MSEASVLTHTAAPSKPKKLDKYNHLVLPPETVEQAVDAFLVLHCAKKSGAYQEWLEHRLKNLVSFLKPGTCIQSVQSWELELWYAELAGKEQRHEANPYRETIEGGLAADTLHGYVRATKTLWNWLVKRQFTQTNPALLLEPPELPELPPRSPLEKDVQTLLEYAKRQNKRSYAAIRLLIQTGIRAGGFEDLTLESVNLEERWVFVREKGKGGKGKSRYVPFDEKTALALEDYFKNERPDIGIDYFFVSSERKSKWTGLGLRLVMQRLCKSADIPLIGPHALRHFLLSNR